ncbi:c-type cytochrome [Pseudoduganella chitinolytica]|uniref:C-type cytochrome n=1 Tax=Pseudoduganella chitinolytica TaxID=34070 RepID=A0ABY8BEV9_9BURK|nr:c-type cytochrome [Pseudoduganella chitinolytica]WEF34430.1 c-type cytochrome [Pseudoduganella chitinolytica]
MNRPFRSHAVRVASASAVAAVLGAGAVAALAGYAVFRGGWYDVAATRQHFQFVHTLLERAMQHSVAFHARDVAVPARAPGAVLHGAGLYSQHCQQCHGAPGVAPLPFAQSMQPVPGPLVDAARHWQPRELYWITRHGIKMSGMPAWGVRLSEAELWALVAFLQRMPHLTAADYRATLAAARPPDTVAPTSMPQPDARRGRVALTQYACQSCHLIPGVTGPATYVGPPLYDLGRRSHIAGLLPNTSEHLAHWIRAPQAVHPATTMPTLGVSERDARDMAAYLLTTRQGSHE